MGVMLSMLSDRSETGRAVQHAIGKRIASVALAKEADLEALRITFDDGTTVELWDDGQSCCESRYMTCDDDLASFAGATIVAISERAADDAEPEDEYGNCHEVSFLVVETDRGTITVATHNEHNGYYGGFALSARRIEVAP
jgi:hypothetical protein